MPEPMPPPGAERDATRRPDESLREHARRTTADRLAAIASGPDPVGGLAAFCAEAKPCDEIPTTHPQFWHALGAALLALRGSRAS